MTSGLLWHYAGDAAVLLAAVGIGFVLGLIWRGPHPRRRR